VKRSHLVLAAAVIVLVVGMVAFPDDFPVGRVAKGALFGSATGLLAIGLVLTYRTTKVINFAYGAMGSVPGALAATLAVDKGWNWGVAAALGVAVGVAIGALIERLIIRRFVNAPRLVLTVATIGLAQLLAGIAIFLPTWLNSSPAIPSVDTMLGAHRWSLHAATITGDDLLLIAVVPIVLIGLTWFLLGSEAGMAVRGMAENMDRARLLGIPVNQLSLLLWAIAGGVAALAVVLRAPSEGVPIAAVAGPTVLLPALAAAVVAGMRSLPGAFVAGVLLGVLDQLVLWNFDEDAPTPIVLLAVIVIALLLQQRGAHRADSQGESSWSMVGVGHRLPRAFAALPEVRVTKVIIAIVVAVPLLGLPFVGSDSQLLWGTYTLAYMLCALSLVVLTGWGGVVSLGQVAVMGVGAVVSANLIADHNADLFVCLAASAVAGGVIALLIGLPALRVSGQFLAVTTLAFAVAMELYLLNPANFTSLLPPSFSRPELWGALELGDFRWLYGLALVLLAAGVFVVRNLRAARAGRAIAATRDNERSAAVAGVNTVRTRLAAFVFSGILAGIAGAMHAVALGGVPNRAYPAITSLVLFSMAVIGGVSSIGGTLVGVYLFMWAGYFYPRGQILLTGVGLLIVLLVVPGGLAQAYERVRDRLVRRWARRHGLIAVHDVETVDEAVEPAPPPIVRRDASGAGLRMGSVRRARLGTHLLAAEDMEASYGTLQVLFGIDMGVERNELLALLGTNGAGKSTVLKSLAGLLPPTSGTVTFDGRDITGMPAEEVAKLGLSLVPGGKGVFPTLTVGENLRLACWMLRQDPRASAAARQDVIAMFPILGERHEQLAGDLSGGEQQQLSLAMAFVTRPKLLCIDELSLGLAPTVVDRLIEKVREIHAAGTTVVVVEQSVNVALLLCHRALFLEKGQVRFRGPTAGLLERPDILRAVFIGGGDHAGAPAAHNVGAPLPPAAPVAGYAPQGAPGYAAPIDGYPPPPGSAAYAAPAASLPPPWERHGRGIVLEARGVSKRFGGIRALDDVYLTVHPATIVGLIGHNGAGKTTLFDVLTGFLPADGGEVLLDGVDITRWPPHRRAIAQVGRTFQEAMLYPSLTVEDAIAVSLEIHLANRDPVAAALRLPASTDSEAAASGRVDQLIELLGLVPYADRPTGELSTGMRRIVELACLLAQDPAVVLFDEPSAGIAQRETEALGPMLRRVQAETGCSMVIIEHDMALLSSMCDSFVALELGSIIAGGTPEQVLHDPRVITSYLGTNEDVITRSGVRRGSSYSSQPSQPRW
jgi:ABC-type branched-subunit amino acid transport system ATPase component/branched-subunit amino acid ABC-type transport system permease component